MQIGGIFSRHNAVKKKRCSLLPTIYGTRMHSNSADVLSCNARLFSLRMKLSICSWSS
jgi:hypothetical protein